VVLDHGAAGADRFRAARTEAFAQCLTRDLCYFDTGAGKCVPCKPGSPECTRNGKKWPDVDLEGLSVPDAWKKNPLEEVCSTWSTLATGTTAANVPGELSLADCPEGGCLGFAFTMPAGFQAKSYTDANAPLVCFDQTAWTKNKLVPAGNDKLCGKPRDPQPGDFCTSTPP
jgi:hypothetical protein